jgi:hypothetical protein
MMRAQGRGMHACIYTGARRRTYGPRRERMAIAYSLCRHPVDIRRAGVGVSVAAIVPGAGVVGADPQDIGSVVCIHGIGIAMLFGF